MSRIALILSGLGCWMALAMGPASAQSTAQELADAWSKAYNDHNLDALSAMYAEDARLMMHGSATHRGRDTIASVWQSDFLSGDPLTFLKVTHTVDGADMILVHGDYQVLDRGFGSELGSGRFAQLWVRVDGGWQLDRDLWNQPYESYEASSAAPLVQELASRWIEAYNGHDREALAQLYSPNAALMMHGAPGYYGRADIADFWEQDFAEGSPLTQITVTHAVDGVDMILVHGDYQVVDRDDGATLGAGRVAHIWLKDASGAWLLDRDLWIAAR